MKACSWCGSLFVQETGGEYHTSCRCMGAVNQVNSLNFELRRDKERNKTMSCPTCDHTMQKLDTWSWCSRCGTVLREHSNQEHVFPLISTPLLVQKCREFQTYLVDVLAVNSVCHKWVNVGVSESIYLPHEGRL